MQSVEELLTVWRRELPDLNTEAFAPLLRAIHLASVVGTFQRRVLEPFEISPSEYEVLAALRRAGSPYRLNPKALTGRLDRSSGGMAKLLKRLEVGGYVQRVPDPEDGRGSLVVLSRRGLELQARILAAFVAAAENRLGELDKDRLAEVDDAMRRLSEAFER
ncbi:MAG: MarR family transcriptional regulator [Myxococcota bacterium]